MDKIKKIPNSVVRFYGNVNFALETIGRSKIMFIHQTLLNDPFDPYMKFNSDFNNDCDLIYEYVKARHPEHIKEFKRYNSRAALGRKFIELKTHLDQTKNSTYIFSTSASKEHAHPKDNLYLWGHYGNGHRGIAIEFDPLQILTSFPDHNHDVGLKKVDPRDAWVAMEYMESAPILTTAAFVDFLRSEQPANDSDFVKYMNATLKAKSTYWKNENEWRMLWKNDETLLKTIHYKINAQSIKNIYIGTRADKQIEEDIAHETKMHFPGAKIYKASVKRAEFALQFSQVYP